MRHLAFIFLCTVAWGQAPLAIAPRAIIDGVLGNTYGSVINGGSVTIPAIPGYTVTGGTAPYTLRVSTGSLPTGVSLLAGGGLTGAPSALGTFVYEIEARDSAARTVRLPNQRIQVVPPPQRSFSLTVGNNFRSGTSCSAGALGGTYGYSLSGSVPPGLSLDGGSGNVVGIPTTAGSFQARWACVLSGGTAARTFTTDFTFNVAAATRVTLNSATVGVPFAFTPSFSGGTAPFQFSVAGNLTPGLRMSNAASGRIDGIPTTPGTFNWTLRRSDSANNTIAVEYFQAVNGQTGYRITPALLSFEAPHGYEGELRKGFSIQGSPPGLPFSVTVSPEASSWLRASSTTGAAPTTLEAIVRSRPLAPGVYEGKIVISAPATQDPSPRAVEVAIRLTVKELEIPSLRAEPAAVGRTAFDNEEASSHTIRITNVGGGIANYSVMLRGCDVRDSLTWMSASGSGGTQLKSGESFTIRTTLNPKGRAPGTTCSRYEISYGAQYPTLEVPVRLTVKESQKCPTVEVNPGGLQFWTRPGGIIQRKEIGVRISGGNVERRWVFKVYSPSEDVVRYTGLETGLETGVLPFVVEPKNFTNQMAASRYLGVDGILSTPCQGSARIVPVDVIVMENPYPSLSAQAVVLPSRNRLTPTESLGIYIVPNGPGQFVWNAEIIDILGSSDAGNIPFFSLSQNGGTVGESGVETTPSPVLVGLIQERGQLPLPSYFQANVRFTFTRSDGSSQQSFLKVMQIVGSAGATVPSTPVLPNPGLFSVNPSGRRNQANVNPPKREELEACPSNKYFLTSFLPRGFAFSSGKKIAIDAMIFDGCGAIVNRGEMQVSFSNGDSAVSLSPGVDGVWRGNWTARNFDEAVIAQFAWKESEESQPVIETVGGSVSEDLSQIVVDPNGITEASTRRPPSIVAPGSLLRIRGKRLATESVESPEGATSLGGSRVLLGTDEARIFAATPEELLLQVPYSAAVGENLPILIRNGFSRGVAEDLNVASAAPGIVTEDGSGSGQGKVYVVSEDGSQSLAAGEAGARPGEELVIEATGLGAVDEEGKVKASLAVLLGESRTEVPVIGAKAMANRPGYYLLRFKLPEGIPSTGALALVVLADGYESPPVAFAVR